MKPEEQRRAEYLQGFRKFLLELGKNVLLGMSLGLVVGLVIRLFMTLLAFEPAVINETSQGVAAVTGCLGVLAATVVTFAIFVGEIEEDDET
jgi:L-cystine uptake protein TcyP (sodium:dicarboxylate symporter family)